MCSYDLNFSFLILLSYAATVCLQYDFAQKVRLNSVLLMSFKDLIPDKPSPLVFIHYFTPLDEKTRTHKDFSLQLHRSRVIRNQSAKNSIF